MAEISDDRLQALERGEKLLQTLMKPKTKNKFEGLVKEHFPDLHTVDDDLEPAMVEIKKLSERFDKLDERFKKETDDAADAKFFAAIDDLQKNHGLTTEGTEKLKQVMKDKIIPDPYVAFNHMRATEPKPEAPSSFTPMEWGFGKKTDDKDVQRLFEDPDGWAVDEARRAWNDAANGRT